MSAWDDTPFRNQMNQAENEMNSAFSDKSAAEQRVSESKDQYDGWSGEAKSVSDFYGKAEDAFGVPQAKDQYESSKMAVNMTQSLINNLPASIVGRSTAAGKSLSTTSFERTYEEGMSNLNRQQDQQTEWTTDAKGNWQTAQDSAFQLSMGNYGAWQDVGNNLLNSWQQRLDHYQRTADVYSAAQQRYSSSQQAYQQAHHQWEMAEAAKRQEALLWSIAQSSRKSVGDMGGGLNINGDVISQTYGDYTVSFNKSTGQESYIYRGQGVSQDAWLRGAQEISGGAVDLNRFWTQGGRTNLIGNDTVANYKAKNYTLYNFGW